MIYTRTCPHCGNVETADSVDAFGTFCSHCKVINSERPVRMNMDKERNLLKSAKITLDTQSDVVSFVSAINSTGSIDKFVVQDNSGDHKVDARSILGMLYASAEFGGDLNLVNISGGEIPTCIDRFRV